MQVYRVAPLVRRRTIGSRKRGESEGVRGRRRREGQSRCEGEYWLAKAEAREAAIHYSPTEVFLLASLAGPALCLAIDRGLAAAANPAVSLPRAQSLDSDASAKTARCQVLELLLRLEAPPTRGDNRLRGCLVATSFPSRISGGREDGGALSMSSGGGHRARAVDSSVATRSRVKGLEPGRASAKERRAVGREGEEHKRRLLGLLLSGQGREGSGQSLAEKGCGALVGFGGASMRFGYGLKRKPSGGIQEVTRYTHLHALNVDGNDARSLALRSVIAASCRRGEAVHERGEGLHLRDKGLGGLSRTRSISCSPCTSSAQFETHLVEQINVGQQAQILTNRLHSSLNVLLLSGRMSTCPTWTFKALTLMPSQPMRAPSSSPTQPLQPSRLFRPLTKESRPTTTRELGSSPSEVARR